MEEYRAKYSCTNSTISSLVNRPSLFWSIMKRVPRWVLSSCISAFLGCLNLIISERFYQSLDRKCDSNNICKYQKLNSGTILVYKLVVGLRDVLLHFQSNCSFKFCVNPFFSSSFVTHFKQLEHDTVFLTSGLTFCTKLKRARNDRAEICFTSWVQA